MAKNGPLPSFYKPAITSELHFPHPAVSEDLVPLHEHGTTSRSRSNNPSFPSRSAICEFEFGFAAHRGVRVLVSDAWGSFVPCWSHHLRESLTFK